MKARASWVDSDALPAGLAAATGRRSALFVSRIEVVPSSSEEGPCSSDCFLSGSTVPFAVAGPRSSEDDRPPVEAVLPQVSPRDRDVARGAVQFSRLLRRRQEIRLFQDERAGTMALQRPRHAGPLPRIDRCAWREAGEISRPLSLDHDRQRGRVSRSLSRGARRMVIPKGRRLFAPGQKTRGSHRLTRATARRQRSREPRDRMLRERLVNANVSGAPASPGPRGPPRLPAARHATHRPHASDAKRPGAAWERGARPTDERRER